jgi:hypothetical protein
MSSFPRRREPSGFREKTLNSRLRGNDVCLILVVTLIGIPQQALVVSEPADEKVRLHPDIRE